MNRAEFLERRKSGIGGSDVAAILGLSKWKTPFQLWQEKTGRVSNDESNDLLHFGNVLENVVADEFSRRRGKQVQRRNQMYRHKEHPELLANIDRYIVGGGVLECKTADKFTAHMWGEAGTDEVPEYYLVQVQHYEHVTEYHEGYLAVLIGGNEYRDFEINYNRDLAEFAAARCLEFWHEYVLKDVPPPATIQDDLNTYYHADSSLLAVANAELIETVMKLKEVKRQIKDAEAVHDELAGKIKLAMAEASTLVDSSGRTLATWKKNKDTEKVVIDWNAIAAIANIAPELITQHTVINIKPGNRNLLIK